MMDGRLDLLFGASLLSLEGNLRVKRLNLFHPALARTPVLDLAATAKLGGTLDLGREVLELDELRWTRFRGVTATLSGKVARLFAKPLIDLRLQVPPRSPARLCWTPSRPRWCPSCRALRSRGNFAADLHTRIDATRRWVS